MNPSDNANTTTTIEKNPQNLPPAEQDPAGAGQSQQVQNKIERFDQSGNVEAHETDHEALRAATNLDNLPASGASAAVAHKASIEAENGEGAYRTRLVSIDTGDQVLTGGLAGNQLITPAGEKYSVQPNEDSGTYQVQKLGASGENQSAPVEGKLTLLTNAFSLESNAQPTFKPKTESAEQSAAAEQTNEAPRQPNNPAQTGSGSAATAPMNGEAFYNQYKSAPPEERLNLAGQYNSMNADQQAQFRSEVQSAAQKDDRSTAINVITQLRQDVRTSSAGDGGDGSGNKQRETAQTAGGDRAAGDGSAGQTGGTAGQRQPNQSEQDRSRQQDQQNQQRQQDQPQQQQRQQDQPQQQQRQDQPQQQQHQDQPQQQQHQDQPQQQQRQDQPPQQQRQDQPQQQQRQDQPQQQQHQDQPQQQQHQDQPQQQQRQDQPPQQQRQDQPQQQQHQDQQQQRQEQPQQQQRQDQPQQQQRQDQPQQQRQDEPPPKQRQQDQPPQQQRSDLQPTQPQQRPDSPQQRPAAQNVDQVGPKNAPGQQGAGLPSEQSGGPKPPQNPNQQGDQAGTAPKNQPAEQNPGQRPNPSQGADQPGARQSLAGDQANRAAAQAAAQAAQNQPVGDRGTGANAPGQTNDRTVNQPGPGPIDKVVPQPAQPVVVDQDRSKIPTPGSDKTAGSGTTPGAVGGDRTVASMGGGAVGENKTVSGAPAGQQIPGADVRVVPLNSANNDARVQQIIQNVDKQTASAAVAGKDVQPPGPVVANPGQPVDKVGAQPPGAQKPGEQRPGIPIAPEVASKGIDATVRAPLPVDQIAGLADASGKVQQQALAGALKQTQDAAQSESAVKGAVSQAGDAATLSRGTTDSSALLQAQRTGIPGLDLKNPQDQQFIGAAMKQLLSANMTDFNPQTQSLKGVLTGLDPARVDKLQSYFMQTGDATKGGVLTRDGMVAQLGLILAANRDTTTAPGQLPGTNPLGDLLRGQPANLIGNSYLAELSKALDGVNRQIGMEAGQNVVGLNALTARTLGPLDQHTTTAEAFTASLTPAQAELIKMLIDLRQTGKPDTATGAKIETGLPGALDAKAGKITDAIAGQTGAKGKEDAVPGAKVLDDKDKELDKGKEEKDKKPKEEDADDITSMDKRKAALLALMAARKLKEAKEKALKEKEKATEKDKKKDDEGKRVQYTVRERDTLQSIALRQLRDVRLAPLIYEINKSVIPIVRQRGRDVFVLKAGQIIWLPSVLESREFRAKLASAAMTPQQSQTPLQQATRAEGALTPEQELAARFGGRADGTLTAEQELATRFGANWSGDPTSPSASPSSGDAQNALISEAVEADRARRENIERMLGPIAEKKKEDDTRIRYVIRLGDTLKSVAMKHPALEDLTLWKLLAEVNNLSLETDDKGMPTAKLSRGTVLNLPLVSEIEAFRKQSATDAQKCPACGTPMDHGATICSGCHPLQDSGQSDEADAGTILMQAAGFVSAPGRTPEEEDGPVG